MEFNNISIKEQIVKSVVKSGNGGAVWVPKDWLGQEVIVILPDKPKLDVKERIIHLLEPYLKDIISVAVFGSYARNEQTKDSDIDVLVITQDKELKIDLKNENIEIISLPIDKFKTAIEKYPAIYYQMVHEAEPLINGSVLEELKSIQFNKTAFKNYLKDTKEHIKSNKEFIELDKIDNVYLKSYSVLYSLILRLRTIFAIGCTLNKDKFSNKKFRSWFISQNLSGKDFDDSYGAYRLIRDNKKVKNLKIKIEVAEKILNILENEVKSFEAKICKREKETSKRHRIN